MFIYDTDLVEARGTRSFCTVIMDFLVICDAIDCYIDLLHEQAQIVTCRVLYLGSTTFLTCRTQYSALYLQGFA